MELYTYKIPRAQSDHRPVVVMPIGDIQYTGKRGNSAMDTLRRDIDRCLHLGGYFIGMGDYTDFLSPSNRQRMRSAALYDTAEDVIDDKALELVHELYETALKPTKNRWLGLVEGHHYATLKTGETTDQRLCQMLNAKFLGTSAGVRIQFQIGAGKSRNNVVLWVHHGSGGGQKACAPLNKLENIAPYWGGVDVFLMGHTTKRPAAPINRVEFRWHGQGAPDLVHKKIYFVSTGGYAKAYEHGTKQGNVPRGGYAEQRMLTPAVLGAPLLRIIPRITKHNGGRMWAPEITVEL